jgi:hypothetical protein
MSEKMYFNQPTLTSDSPLIRKNDTVMRKAISLHERLIAT